jgi:hypothetical protein
MIKVKTQGKYAITESAFGQMCAKLKIPGDYMQRCPLDLRNQNLAYWKDQNDDRKIMIRTRRFDEKEVKEEGGAGVIRAILPATYEPIDNFRIGQWIGDVISKYEGDIGIQSARISDNLHIRLLFDKSYNFGSKQNPDPHFFGIHVSDSEVGERSFITDFTMFRIHCFNGSIHMVEGDHLLAQRHIHVDFKNLRRGFIEAFKRSIEYRDTVVDIFESAMSAEIKDAHSYIRRIVRHYRGTNEFAEAVIQAYDAEPAPTKFGVVQAITRAAKRMPVDSRVDTEAIAGQFLLENN